MLERAARCAALHRLDEPRVLGSHLVVEREHLVDPGLFGALGEEVVEPGGGAVGGHRPQRADRQVRPARVHVELHRREEDVVLRRRDAAGHVVRRVRPVRVRVDRRELAQPEAVHLHPLALLVDHLHEVRVVELAVVALEVVLDRDLPVRLDLVEPAAVEAERVHVQRRSRPRPQAGCRARRRAAARPCPG